MPADATFDVELNLIIWIYRLESLSNYVESLNIFSLDRWVKDADGRDVIERGTASEMNMAYEHVIFTLQTLNNRSVRNSNNNVSIRVTPENRDEYLADLQVVVNIVTGILKAVNPGWDGTL